MGRFPVAIDCLLVASGALIVFGCGSTQVGALDPKPRPMARGHAAPVSLDLPDTVPDQFRTAVGSSQVHVQAWHRTLGNGFKSGFGVTQAHRGESILTVQLQRTDLRIVSERETGSRRARYALVGDPTQLAHGSPAPPATSAPPQIAHYAEIVWEASLLGADGQAVDWAAGIARAVRTTRGTDARSLGTTIESAVEEMFEQLAAELLTESPRDPLSRRAAASWLGAPARLGFWHP